MFTGWPDTARLKDLKLHSNILLTYIYYTYKYLFLVSFQKLALFGDIPFNSLDVAQVLGYFKFSIHYIYIGLHTASLKETILFIPRYTLL